MSATSILTAKASPPLAVISWTSSASFSSLRAATGTLARASASACAVSRPMPWEAPVTTATLSRKLNIPLQPVPHPFRGEGVHNTFDHASTIENPQALPALLAAGRRRQAEGLSYKPAATPRPSCKLQPNGPSAATDRPFKNFYAASDLAAVMRSTVACKLFS